MKIKDSDNHRSQAVPETKSGLYSKQDIINANNKMIEYYKMPEPRPPIPKRVTVTPEELNTAWEKIYPCRLKK